MNGQTSKLIRNVAAVRGIKSPRKVRALKREYYNLNEEERELQKIDWRMEVDGFISDLEEAYGERVDAVKRNLNKEAKRAELHKNSADFIQKRYDRLKERIDTAPFSKRLGYLVTGKMEGV